MTLHRACGVLPVPRHSPVSRFRPRVAYVFTVDDEVGPSEPHLRGTSGARPWAPTAAHWARHQKISSNWFCRWTKRLKVRSGPSNKDFLPLWPVLDAHFSPRSRDPPYEPLLDVSIGSSPPGEAGPSKPRPRSTLPVGNPHPAMDAQPPAVGLASGTKVAAVGVSGMGRAVRTHAAPRTRRVVEAGGIL